MVQNNDKKHDCKKELREADLKATPVRLAALTILESANVPLDATSIHILLKKQGINADPATVFRMMNSFTRKGLVREINFNESKLRYEYSAKANHHHLLCQSCGRIEDIRECGVKKLEKEIERKKGFLVIQHSLEFFGFCKNCRN